jgi:energy-coupling factor transport system ATP-binding protein
MAYYEADKISYEIHGRTIFQEISFQLDQKEFVSLVGANGIGKTTLSKLMIGMQKPSEGEILLDGVPVSKYALFEVGRKVGYLFQNPSCQIFCPTILEELLFSLRFQGGETEEGRKRAAEMMRRFSLEDAKESPTHHLSQGEKQRLALAAILMNQPKYLILDEPTTGLDRVRKADLGRYLQEIHHSGVGIMMISHDREFVNQMSQRILRLDDGGLYEDDRV